MSSDNLTTTVPNVSPTFTVILQKPLHDTIFYFKSTNPSNNEVAGVQHLNIEVDEHDDAFDFWSNFV